MQAAENTRIPLSFAGVRELAETDMQAVDALIRESLASDVALVSQVSQ